ncbi:MAG: hypothetical protein QNJ63_25920 [Calothrix sp. MO_192.B10]|nr:hypothetical protein [Calothrix sp. MO_192.B10]
MFSSATKPIANNEVSIVGWVEERNPTFFVRFFGLLYSSRKRSLREAAVVSTLRSTQPTR